MLILSIRTRQDFVNIQKNKDTAFHTKNLILLTKKTPEKYIEVTQKRRAKEFVRFGMAVTKKLDKSAVKRNRIKRRLREAFKQVNLDLFKVHTDYEIIARRNLTKANFQDIVKDIENCLLGKTRKGFPVKRSKKRK